MSARVAYMTGEYPRATDTFIQREVAALRLAGVVVETFSVRKPSMKETVGPEQQAERERTTYLLPFKPLTFLGAHLSLLIASPAGYLSALKTALTIRPAGLKPLIWQIAYFAEAGLVARHVRDRKLTHLHNHFSNSSCSVAMLAAEMGGFTFSFTMHGPAEFFEPKYWRIDEKIRRALFVSCISWFCRSQAMCFAPPECWEKLHIIHCGVDPALFETVQHRPGAKRLLFVGRLAPVKGLPVLLEAMGQLRRRHPQAELLIAGDGPDRARLERKAVELGIADRTRFLGYQSQAQVRQLLSGTDVFVMASFAEGVPVVLMEAMAAGVPVVAPQIAGIPELVENGVNGWLTPPGDALSLCNILESLLNDAATRQRMGAAGRGRVEQEFNIAFESQRLVSLLTNALAGRSSAIRPEPQIAPPQAPATAPVAAGMESADVPLDARMSPA